MDIPTKVLPQPRSVLRIMAALLDRQDGTIRILDSPASRMNDVPLTGLSASSGARLILAPGWAPVVWTEADRKKGQARGLKSIETFHTRGTPPVPGGGR